MSSVKIQGSKSYSSMITLDSKIPETTQEYRYQYISILLNMKNNFHNVILFDSYVIALVPLIPADLHEIISVEVLTVLLLSKFPKLLLLYQHLTCHFDAFIQYLQNYDAEHQRNLQEFTLNLIYSTKQTVQQMIGQNLNPSQIFIILTCIELFQNLKKMPLKIVLAAVNNCFYQSETITDARHLPSIYSLITSIEAPFLPAFQSQEFSLVLDLDSARNFTTQLSKYISVGEISKKSLTYLKKWKNF